MLWHYIVALLCLCVLWGVLYAGGMYLCGELTKESLRVLWFLPVGAAFGISMLTAHWWSDLIRETDYDS